MVESQEDKVYVQESKYLLNVSNIISNNTIAFS